METHKNLKPFVKGDPRINRKGRPKGFAGLRELARQIAHEVATKKGGGDLVIDGHKATVTEAIMRQWANSGNPKMQQAFIEIAYGKVPNDYHVTGSVSIDLDGLTPEQLKRIADGEDPVRVTAGS